MAGPSGDSTSHTVPPVPTGDMVHESALHGSGCSTAGSSDDELRSTSTVTTTTSLPSSLGSLSDGTGTVSGSASKSTTPERCVAPSVPGRATANVNVTPRQADGRPGADGALSAALEQLRMLPYRAALATLGVFELADLVDVDDSMLASIAMPVVQRKRLLRYINGKAAHDVSTLSGAPVGAIRAGGLSATGEGVAASLLPSVLTPTTSAFETREDATPDNSKYRHHDPLTSCAPSGVCTTPATPTARARGIYTERDESGEPPQWRARNSYAIVIGINRYLSTVRYSYAQPSPSQWCTIAATRATVSSCQW